MEVYIPDIYVKSVYKIDYDKLKEIENIGENEYGK